MVQLIVMAVGPDRPGIVGELTAHLHASGANLLDSRMINLRGQFAMLILLELSEESAAKLTSELPNVGRQMNLLIEVHPQSRRAAPPARGLVYKLKTYSLDQPGILARLTQVLRQHGINIEELSTRQESAAFDGGLIFLTEMRLTVPTDIPLGKLRAELARIGNELNCDVDLDPAE